MREWRLLGSVRGVRSNAHSYREQHTLKPVIPEVSIRGYELPEMAPELGLIVDGRGSTDTNRLTLSFPIMALTPRQATSTVTWRATDHWQASTHVVNVQDRSFTLTPEVVLHGFHPRGAEISVSVKTKKQL